MYDWKREKTSHLPQLSIGFSLYVRTYLHLAFKKARNSTLKVYKNKKLNITQHTDTMVKQMKFSRCHADLSPITYRFLSQTIKAGLCVELDVSGCLTSTTVFFILLSMLSSSCGHKNIYTKLPVNLYIVGPITWAPSKLVHSWSDHTTDT